MKAVMLSRKPNEVKNLLDGLLKYIITKDRLPLNTTVYVYCTLRGMYELFKQIGHKYLEEEWYDKKGKVVAKIELDKIEEFCLVDIPYNEEQFQLNIYDDIRNILNGACVTRKDIFDSVNWGLKPLYAHHISKVEIIEPKEIAEFKHWKTKTIYSGMDCPPYSDEVLIPLSKAPSVYCYVEVGE